MIIRLLLNGEACATVPIDQVEGLLVSEYADAIHPDDTQLYSRFLGLPSIEAWRFHAVISSHNLIDGLEAVLSSMPQPDQSKARARLEYSHTYSRFDGMVDQLGAALGLTLEQLDDLWREAASL